ncbi:MAG: hypothetical protein JST36_10790 [Bacteroidetes bacterium]|nr:hypothetical protein [Bacteroidota bacterium]
MYIHLLLILGIFSSCNFPITFRPKLSKAAFVDSFTVNDYGDISELGNWCLLGDSLIISLDQSCNQLRFYKKNTLSEFEFENRLSLNISGYISVFSLLNDTSCIFGNLDNEFYLYSIHNGKIKPLKYNNRQQKLLGNNYMLSTLAYHPLVTVDSGVFFINMYYRSLDGYFKYFGENLVCKFVIRGDSLINEGTLISKPSGLNSYRQPWGRYTSVQEKGYFYLIFPPFDSLYIYDFHENVILKRFCIGNQYYKNPTAFSFDSIFSKFGNQYEYEYDIANFEYYGVFYNPISKNTLLLFSSPNARTEIGDKKLLGLVLNHDFKTIKYVDFSFYNFFGINCTVLMPNGNLGFLIYENNKAIKRDSIKVLVYTF